MTLSKQVTDYLEATFGDHYRRKYRDLADRNLAVLIDLMDKFYAVQGGSIKAGDIAQRIVEYIHEYAERDNVYYVVLIVDLLFWTPYRSLVAATRDAKRATTTEPIDFTTPLKDHSMINFKACYGNRIWRARIWYPYLADYFRRNLNVHARLPDGRRRRYILDGFPLNPQNVKMDDPERTIVHRPPNPSWPPCRNEHPYTLGDIVCPVSLTSKRSYVQVITPRNSQCIEGDNRLLWWAATVATNGHLFDNCDAMVVSIDGDVYMGVLLMYERLRVSGRHEPVIVCRSHQPRSTYVEMEGDTYADSRRTIIDAQSVRRGLCTLLSGMGFPKETAVSQLLFFASLCNDYVPSFPGVQFKRLWEGYLRNGITIQAKLPTVDSRSVRGPSSFTYHQDCHDAERIPSLCYLIGVTIAHGHIWRTVNPRFVFQLFIDSGLGKPTPMPESVYEICAKASWYMNFLHFETWGYNPAPDLYESKGRTYFVTFRDGYVRHSTKEK